MARKEAASSTPKQSQKTSVSKDKKNSRVPSGLRLPVLVLSSLILSVLLYSIVPNVSGYELATVSRSLDEPWQLAERVVVKVLELGVAWSFGLDGYDFGSLFILYSAPYYFLLYFFYDVHYFAVLSTFGIDLIANVAPFYALRSLNPHNRLQALKTEDATLASLSTINMCTTIFAAAIYGVVIYTSLYTWLPVYLITKFDSLRTLEHAHSTSLAFLIAVSLPLGFAAKNFLFVPSIAVPGIPSKRAQAAFDPKTATFGQTLRRSLGLGPKNAGRRGEMLVKRTLVLAVMTLVFAYTKIYGTVAGAEAWGAIGWGAVFAGAGILTGLGFVWVGHV